MQNLNYVNEIQRQNEMKCSTEYFVYMLNHVHEISEINIDIKLIGMFDSDSTVKQGIKKAITQSGFRETPNGFVINKILLNETNCEEGFLNEGSLVNFLKKTKLLNKSAKPIIELNISNLFMLSHFYDIDDNKEDIRYIGIYSTKQKANFAIKSLINKPGFIQHKDSFNISELTLNRNYWEEGYITV